jgi:hypothetical protein
MTMRTTKQSLTAPDWLMRQIVTANGFSVCEALHVPFVGEKQPCITSPGWPNAYKTAAEKPLIGTVLRFPGPTRRLLTGCDYGSEAQALDDQPSRRTQGASMAVVIVPMA